MKLLRLSEVRASLVAQLVKNLPVIQETWVQSLGWEDPWRREWQPTPVFLSGESHGQRSLVGYSPWGPKESDTTEVTYLCWHGALGLFTTAAALFFFFWACKNALLLTHMKLGVTTWFALVSGAWTEVMDIILRESCESQYMFYEFLFFQTSSVSCEDCSLHLGPGLRTEM